MDRGFDALQRGYAWSLGLILRHRLVMLAVFGAVLLTTLHMFGVVHKGFIPDRTTTSCSSTCARRRGRRS
jgi:multidrug efflux pump subunit AcrB